MMNVDMVDTSLVVHIPNMRLSVNMADTVATNTFLPLLDTSGATILDTGGMEIDSPGASSALVFHSKMPDLRLNGDL
jgi:hypothetical protein